MHVSIHRRESSVPMTPSQAERQAGRVVLPFLATPKDPEVQGVTRVGCRWLGAGGEGPTDP